MSSQTTDAGTPPTQQSSPATVSIEPTKAIPLSKMSALARAKAKREKFLTSVKDYSEPPPETSREIEGAASRGLEAGSISKQPTPEPQGLWRAKTPSLTSLTGCVAPSNSHAGADTKSHSTAYSTFEYGDDCIDDGLPGEVIFESGFGGTNNSYVDFRRRCKLRRCKLRR